MWNKLFAFFLLFTLLSLVFGKMDAETMYEFLSRRIDDLSFEARTIQLNVGTLDKRILTVEVNVNQLMSTIQQCTENSKSVVPGQETVLDLKESINFQALALRKSMTKEKSLLRESVKQVTKNFYGLQEHMQRQMSDFFETVAKQLLAANNSIEATSTEIKTINDVVRKISVDTGREIERFSSTLISESEDLRRGLEELKRDLKAEIDQIHLELKSILAKVKGQPQDCREARDNGNIKSDIYTIVLWKSRQTIKVYCDMTTDGGGWTVFQNRFNGSVDFYKPLSEYQNGFGSLEGEFWSGLRYIHEMTDPANGPSELRLDLSAADGSTAYEVFQNFYLSDGINYTLNIDNGTGSAGDTQGLSYSKGYGFTTYDRDLDVRSQENCADVDRGGWWYGNCAYANLNGEYVTPGTTRPLRGEGGMTYRDFKGVESLKTSKMMFRRTG